MIILVDDKRNSETGIICRGIAAARLVIEAAFSSGDYLYSTLALDHDLGPDGSGLDLLVWARDSKIELPRTIQLVTNNPVGAQNMAALLVNDLGYEESMACAFNGGTQMLEMVGRMFSK